MRKCATALMLAAAFLVAAAPAGADTVLLALLVGENEVPPVNTPGYGFALFYIPDDGSYIFYYVEFSDLLAPARSSHVHLGPPGRSGPVLFNLARVPAVTSGYFWGVLTADDFQPVGGILSYEEAILVMMAGGAYVNVHSRGYANGEVRGQTFVYEEP